MTTPTRHCDECEHFAYYDGPHCAKDTGPANDARHAAAVAKYRAVMGGEWVPTWIIESELGLGQAAPCLTCTSGKNSTWSKRNQQALTERFDATPVTFGDSSNKVTPPCHMISG